ncbi:GrpE, mitochondrial [Savitreella phatthalungensis]
MRIPLSQRPTRCLGLLNTQVTAKRTYADSTTKAGEQAQKAAEETFTETSTTTGDAGTGKTSASEKPASESNTATPETKGVPASEGTASDAASSAAAEKMEATEKQLAEFKDKYIRQVAEYRNLQSRNERELTSARDFAIQKFAKDLIETVDNLDRALSTVPENLREDKTNHPDLASLYGGLRMTEGILLRTLEKHGLKKFDGMGDKFNPNLHEVLYEAPVPGKEAGTIIQCQSTGFTLNGRTIRAAKVGVAKATE